MLQKQIVETFDKTLDVSLILDILCIFLEQKFPMYALRIPI